MKRSILVFLSLVFLAFGTVLGGCRGLESEDAPVVPIRNMYNQSRLNPQAESEFFADKRTMRAPIDGTVAREMPATLDEQTGRTADNGAWLEFIPAELFDNRSPEDRAAFLAQGNKQFDIYCAPCHGISGDGNGLIAKRAKELGASSIAPPIKFSDAKVRKMPDGQLFATISNGVRNMPAYKHAIPNQDRWAIVAYMRALQLGQGE